MAICTDFVLSAVNYQTVSNDLFLDSVQTNNCFYRRYNTAGVRKSQIVARLFTANLILLDFTDYSWKKNRLFRWSVAIFSDKFSNLMLLS